MKLYMTIHDVRHMRARVDGRNETYWLELTFVDPSGNTETINIFADSRHREPYLRTLAQAINQVTFIGEEVHATSDN